MIKGDFAAAFELYPAIYPLTALLLFILTTAFVKVRFEMTIKIILAIATGLVMILSYSIKMNLIN